VYICIHTSLSLSPTLSLSLSLSPSLTPSLPQLQGQERQEGQTEVRSEPVEDAKSMQLKLCLYLEALHAAMECGVAL
jgi:hypothetical protein